MLRDGVLEMTSFGNQAARRPRRSGTDFLRNEDGIIAPLVLVFFFLMLVIGGIAVDVMRFETQRVAVQNTLDRATLAAASMEQALSSDNTKAETVVRDWFTKAGISNALDSVTPDVGVNYKIMEAKATVKSNNFFMSMLDVPYLTTVNASRAEQGVSNVEIIMVLDVSGSMGDPIYNEKGQNVGTKIAALKKAAKDFVDEVKSKDAFNRITIGIVPYNAQVNAGPTFLSKFNAIYPHGAANVNCVEFPTTDAFFKQTPISRTTPLPMMANADTNWPGSASGSYGAWSSSGAPSNSALRRLCAPSTTNVIMLPTTNATTAKNAIDALSADGYTSIFMGMRWASMMVDPTTRPIYNELITAGAMGHDMDDRPYDYGTGEATKVIIVMTDGEHTTHNRVVDAYKAGTSDIWRSTTSDKNFSIFHSNKVDASTATRLCNSRPFWVPHLSAWHSRPWNGTTPSGTACYSPTATYTNVQRQTWNQVWNAVKVSWVAEQLYSRAGKSYSTWMDTFLDQYTSNSRADALLKMNCTAAKEQGVLVFGIAFEAPSVGQTAIKNCTSLPWDKYYFDVEGLQIETAFKMIASQLSHLRLTQ